MNTEASCRDEEVQCVSLFTGIASNMDASTARPQNHVYLSGHNQYFAQTLSQHENV